MEFIQGLKALWRGFFNGTLEHQINNVNIVSEREMHEITKSRLRMTKRESKYLRYQWEQEKKKVARLELKLRYLETKTI